MELIKFEEYIKKYNKKLVATIGNFDGIHLGHQELINQTVDKAKELDICSAVITFDPHPLNVIANEKHFTMTSLDDKVKLIKKYDIDYLILINFNDTFSKISKIDFIYNYLIKMNISNLILGSDFRFGVNGEGKACEIDDLSNGVIKTTIIDLIKYNDVKIGSSNIIKLLNEGKLEEANNLLGYNYSFTGFVIKGKQIGRTIGFPTANIDNQNVKKILKTGVYGVNVYLSGNTYVGMMNIGHNPTCNFQDDISIEINIFDLDIDLYEKSLKIECFCYVREEIKFNNVNELIERLKLDKEIIRNKNLLLAKK